MLNLIEPRSLRSVWPIVRHGLDVVVQKNRVDWIPEDVYHALKSGTAALHFSGEGSFLVTCLNVNDYTDNRELHIWIAYSADESRNVIDEGLELLKAMAKNAGATRITFDSPRKGWERRYTMITATYEVSL